MQDYKMTVDDFAGSAIVDDRVSSWLPTRAEGIGRCYLSVTLMDPVAAT
jgi:hypothetical protein